MPLNPPSSPNTLGSLYVSTLAPWFGRARSDGAHEPLLDPWWWPRHAGATRADWGPDGDVAPHMLRSLQGRDPSGSGANARYLGFRGSVGDPARCTRWILSSRPSCGVFPSHTTTKLVKVLHQLGWLEDTHVCDVIKFRGPGPDARADEGLTDEHWNLSLTLLANEFELTQPEVVLVAGRKTQAWVDRVIAQRKDGPHGAFLAALEPRIRRVTSWMAYVPPSQIVSAWADAAGTAAQPAVACVPEASSCCDALTAEDASKLTIPVCDSVERVAATLCDAGHGFTLRRNASQVSFWVNGAMVACVKTGNGALNPRFPSVKARNAARLRLEGVGLRVRNDGCSGNVPRLLFVVPPDRWTDDACMAEVRRALLGWDVGGTAR
jgi:hypothetical protein